MPGLRYLPQPALDAAAYQACLEAAAPPLPYGHAAWLRAVANGRWGALAWPGEDGGYAAVLPLVVGHKAGLLPYVHLPPFTQRLDLLARPGAPVLNFAAEAGAYLRRHYLRADLAVTDAAVARALGGRVSPRQNLVLDLSQTATALEAGLGKSIRQKLRQAEAAGLHLADAPSALTAFAYIQQWLAPRLPGWTRWYSYAWGRLPVVPGAPFSLRGRLACQGQAVVAAAVFVDYGPRTIYLAGAATEAGLATGATAHLLWQEIKERAGTASTLDFEGGSLGGTRQFFSMFGAMAEDYYAVRLGI